MSLGGPAAPAGARLRRTYFDCRFGQLHVHQAIPPGGGFDEATALLCLPGRWGLGQFFAALLGPLGSNRSIYAPDLPGSGGSDGPPGALGPTPYAQAMLDLFDALRQRRVDVLTHGSGALIALALLAQRPGLVRRIAASAADSASLAAARRAGLSVREFALAGAEEPGVAPATARAQINELREFLGADAPAGD